MPKTRAIGATAVMLSVLAVAGCGGGSGDGAASPTFTGAKGVASGEPTPPQTSTSSAPSSTTTTPTANGTEAGAPGVPKAARQHTKAGSEAFVVYYVNALNDAGMRPSKTALPQISAKSCDTCAEWIGVGTKLRAAGEHYEKQVYSSPKFKDVIVFDSEITHLTSNLVQPNKVDVINQSGEVVRSLSPSHLDVEFVVKWTSNGWIMDEVVSRA